MCWNPDAPAPPDLAFPGWEGPVFVAQLFGTTDIIAACFRVVCWQWKLFAVFLLLSGPVAFFVVAVYKVYRLVAKNRTAKVAGLVFNESPKRSYGEMWAGLTEGGICTGVSQCFIFVMDIRFRGGWMKKDAEARFWGFLMGAYTDEFWLVIGWIFSKKLFVALNKRLLEGSHNAVVNLVIYGIDLLLFAWKRPFR